MALRVVAGPMPEDHAADQPQSARRDDWRGRQLHRIRGQPQSISAPGPSFRYDKFADAQAVRKTRPRRGKKSIDVEWRFRRIGQPAAYKFRRRLVVHQSRRIATRDLGCRPAPLHDDYRLTL